MRTWMVRAAILAGGAGLLVGCQQESYSDLMKASGEMEAAAASRSTAPGKPAPEFLLPDQEGRPVSLGDLRGKWVVLYFYPKDDTPGCTCQANEFTELLWAFRDMNATVLGISADDPESHRHFTDKYGLALTLLSDIDRKVMRQYGAWVESSLGDYQYGRVIRSSYIIDPQGVIRHHWPEVLPKGHAERVRRKLAELQSAA